MKKQGIREAVDSYKVTFQFTGLPMDDCKKNWKESLLDRNALLAAAWTPLVSLLISYIDPKLFRPGIFSRAESSSDFAFSISKLKITFSETSQEGN